MEEVTGWFTEHWSIDFPSVHLSAHVVFVMGTFSEKQFMLAPGHTTGLF